MKHAVRLLLLPLAMIALALFVSCSLFDSSTEVEAGGDVISDSLLIDDEGKSQNDPNYFSLTIKIKPITSGNTELYVSINVGKAYKDIDLTYSRIKVSGVGGMFVIDSLERGSSRSYRLSVQKSIEFEPGSQCRIFVSIPHFGTSSKVVSVPKAPVLHSAKDTLFHDRNFLSVSYRSNSDFGSRVSFRYYSQFENSKQEVKKESDGQIIRRNDSTILFGHSKISDEYGFEYMGYIVEAQAYRRDTMYSLSDRARITFYSPFSNTLQGQ